MGRFRKKPVEIEAFRWTGGPDQDEDPVWICEAISRGEISFVKPRGVDNVTLMMIQTLEGVMQARSGDWIIQGVEGEIYPCRPDIFAATYEAVEPDDSLQRDNGLAEAAYRMLKEDHPC